MGDAGNEGLQDARSASGLTALRQVKKAEAEITDKKEQAREEASTILTEARKEAREILEDARQEAENDAERIILEAREEAQEEADAILATAKTQATELRDVSDTRLEEATDAVVDRFIERIGGV